MSDLENKDKAERDGKYGDRGVRVESPFLERLDSFWFHHKGKVIAAIALLLAVLVTVIPLFGRRKSDVMTVYSGPVYLSGAELTEIENLLSVLYEKRMGDDGALIGLTQYVVYSKGQIESIRAETNAESEQNFVNSEMNSENYEALYEYIMTGDTAVLLLDPWLYEELRKNDRLTPMREIFETMPPSVDENGYGVVLGETGLYAYYGVLKKLPAETVVCFLKPYVFGNTSDKNAYEKMKEVFRMIAEFDAPSGAESAS